jgi:hypothetical protein
MPANLGACSVHTDQLGEVLDQFRTVLGEHAGSDEHNWAGRMWYATGRLEKELQRHIELTKGPDGLAAEVDQSRPTLVRQQEKLQQDYQNLLEQCLALKWEMYRLSQPLDGPKAELGKSLPAAVENASTGPVDVAILRERLEQFLTRLEEHQQKEASLVLESVTTDIGAGD